MALSAAVVIFWVAALGEVAPGLRWTWALMGATCVAMFAYRMLKPLSGTLRWDGSRWFWQADGTASAQALSAVDITVDLQVALLLRLKTMPTPPAKRSRSLWLTLHRSRLDEQWVALCATLYATQGFSASDGKRPDIR